MIYSAKIEKLIIAAIQEDPTRPLILPDHAYGYGERVIIEDDYLPIDLHRYLHNILIRPLGYHEWMMRKPGVPFRNINPYLFVVAETKRSTRTRCNQGHPYEGNEAPPNGYRYRCATCFREFCKRKLQEGAGPANKVKTHCPYGHLYDKENTLRRSDGKRRCRKCVNAANRRYMAARRKEQRAA